MLPQCEAVYFTIGFPVNQCPATAMSIISLDFSPPEGDKNGKEIFFSCDKHKKYFQLNYSDIYKEI